MSPTGCRPAAVVAQPDMGTASRAATVVHQYGHFRRFSQRSPAGAWLLAPRTIYDAARSPHGTTLEHPISQNSSAKKVIRNFEFSEKYGILEKHQCQMMQLKMHGYMSARKWSLVVNSHLRMAVGYPFIAVGGLKGAPWVPVREHVTPFNLTVYLPGGGALLFLSGRLAGAHKQSVLRSGGKIVLALENSWVVPVKAV
jgi:hypothetical protein